MNRVETWAVEYMEDIDTKVNSYCRMHNLNPISISITYGKTSFIVAVVVEERGRC